MHRKSASVVQDTIADLKRRREVMAGSVQSNQWKFTGNHNQSIASVYQNILEKNKSLEVIIKSQKSIVMHFDEIYFTNLQKERKLQNFLETYFSHKDLSPLKNMQILSSFSFKKQQLQTCEQSFYDEAQTKLLKMNLKYCLFSKAEQIQKESKPQNIYILMSGQNSHEKSDMYQHLIDWTENSFVCIFQDSNNNSYHLYLSLLTSFCSLISSFENQTYQFFQNKMIPPIFVINKLEDLIEEKVFQKSVGQSNLRRLCELQYNLFKAETQLKNQEAEQEIRNKFAQAYLQKFMKNTISSLTKFMRFHKKKQTNLNLKYFNFWSLVTCEAVLKKMDKEIIDQKYCQQKYEKELKAKIFFNWKIYHLKVKEQKYWEQ